MASTAPPPSASLLQLQSVFAALDSISPALPPTQSITVAKLREALSIHAHWSFPEVDPPALSSTAAAAGGPGAEDSERRRRRREEKEDLLRDIVDAVDLNKNGKIEFNELLKVVEADRERQAKAEAQQKGRGPLSNAGQDEDEDEEGWEPTRDNVRAVFNAADKDRDGLISVSELAAFLRSQGVDYLMEQQINDIVSSDQALSIDPSSSSAGGIHFPAFLRMMTAAPVGK